MIVIGGEDKILPSEEEGRRLLSILTDRSPHCKGRLTITRPIDSSLYNVSFFSDGKAVDLVEFPERGHSLLDGSFDLLSVMGATLTFQEFNLTDGGMDKAKEELSSSGGYLTSVSTRPASPTTLPAPSPVHPVDPYEVVYPSKEDLALADRFVEPLWALTSPVFLSRDETGRVVRGLGPVPTGQQGRPVLLVGNHQLLGTFTLSI